MVRTLNIRLFFYKISAPMFIFEPIRNCEGVIWIIKWILINNENLAFSCLLSSFNERGWRQDRERNFERRDFTPLGIGKWGKISAVWFLWRGHVKVNKEGIVRAKYKSIYFGKCCTAWWQQSWNVTQNKLWGLYKNYVSNGVDIVTQITRHDEYPVTIIPTRPSDLGLFSVEFQLSLR